MNPLHDIIVELTRKTLPMLGQAVIGVQHGMERLAAENGSRQIAQRQLYLALRAQHQAGCAPDFREMGFREFSQLDEDGILLWIFAAIGFTNRQLLDIAFGSPYSANSTNLLLRWGFSGLLIEGDPKAVERTRAFFAGHPDMSLLPPTNIAAWVTAENINTLCTDNGLPPEIDLFSLDVDGVDYWLWEALEAARPRVVVTEIQACLGAETSVTVPYDPAFDRRRMHENFFGASIAAMVALAKRKGYRLVACNRIGFNLFFVRNDLGRESLPEIPPATCFSNETAALAQKRATRREEIAHLPWQQV